MTEAIAAHLDTELAWLRLLLERRALWLRGLWTRDRDDDWRQLAITDHEANLALSGTLDLASEWRFYARDDAARALAARIATARARADSVRAVDIPFVRLTGMFGLTRFEESALLACLAPEIDPSFSTIYGYVQDDGRRRFPTAHLITALFADPETYLEAGARLGPSGTLRRYRLVEPGDQDMSGAPLATRPLLAASRITHYLTGALADDVEPVPGVRRAEEVWRSEWVERSAEAVLARAASATRINLTGPANASKELIAAAVATRRGQRLMVLEPARLPGGDSERLGLYRILDREARLGALAYYVPSQDSEPLVRLVSEIADCLEAPLFLDTAERIIARQMRIVAVQSASRAEQKSIWRQALADVPHSVEGALDAIVQQFDLGPAHIREAVDEASSQCPVQAPALWEICRRLSGWKLSDLAQRITPKYSWNDIILGADEERQLREIAGQVAQRARVYEEWGFSARLPRGRGISALFAGPSGTGKTMAAEILASDLQLDLYVIDLAGMVSKYIGETEKNLRRVFDAAEQSGAILFFDEADALFGKRSEVKDSHDRYANIEVDYLLQKMEQYQGLAILSTNRRAALDRAFLRRLRFLVDFRFPNRESRERIWHKMFPPQAPVEDLDFALLSRLEVAGGNIRNIVVNAAFLASAAGSPIRTDHVMRAVRQEYSKIDKLVTETEFGPHYRSATA